MIKKIKSLLTHSINEAPINNLRNDIVKTNINNGKILGELNLLFKTDKILKDIKLAEFKVFSQWGDDGIINFLINYLDIENKNFIEFGVENYTECNTRFLLINDNWSGLIIDGSPKNMEAVRNEGLYWQHDLKAVGSFVTAENINQLFSENGFSGEIGLLHIDIDGNDYWVWNSITVVNPVMVIVEYNSLFGYDKPWTVPYDPAFVRSEKHFSTLYYGTSLLSLCDLAEEKGYSFIGCNANGNNAYFVRKDKMKNLEPKTAREGYILSKFSESRNEAGELTFLRNESRTLVLKGMPVFNTRTNELENI